MPPITVRQTLPPFRFAQTTAGHATVAVVIDEAGGVESITTIVSLEKAYDRQIQEAAKAWRYTPATVDGVPVKFRKLVQINVAPPSR